MTNIICAGFGGQGVLTAGLIIAKIAMDNGKNVIWLPSYGSEMRGGTANCNIKISDEEIASPFIKDIDILIAMNEPSIAKFQDKVKEKGIILTNSSIVKNKKFRKDLLIYEIDATDIATNLENPRGTNIVMIGAFTKAFGVFEKEIMKKGIDNFFLSKGKNNSLNSICFEEGFNNVKMVELN